MDGAGALRAGGRRSPPRPLASGTNRGGIPPRGGSPAAGPREGDHGRFESRRARGRWPRSESLDLRRAGARISVMARLRLPLLAITVVLAAAGASIAATNRSDGKSARPSSCPVTLSNHPRANFAVSRKFGYRQGRIAVELWPLGVTLVQRSDITPDGAFGVKVGWYRYGRGKLTITATRLDKPGRVIRTSVPSGYGSTGFQASGIDFPSAGCWKVTGTVGQSHLTYVTVVLKVQSVRGRVIE